MKEYENRIIDWLFDTGAIRICPPDKPFWYTSGKIGPYYINTHFLFGNEIKATQMLDYIDDVVEDNIHCPKKVLERLRHNYESDEIYRGVIDLLTDYINDNLNIGGIDYISGGERRDWFFSLIVADIIKIPHITLYKSGEHMVLHKGKVSKSPNVDGALVLHLADIITEASSYINKWIPSVRNLNGYMKWSLVVVDRLQGGAENLSSENVQSHSLAKVDRNMFTRAYNNGNIGSNEYEMLFRYLEDPEGSMAAFLRKNPLFIEESLKSDERTASRARKCLEKGFYGLTALK